MKNIKIINAMLSMKIMIGRTKAKDDIIRIIEKLRPKKTEHELIRVGGNGDGGYLLPNDLVGIKACYSPGVSNICDFEKDLADRGIMSFMADYSVDAPPEKNKKFQFIKKFLGSIDNNTYIRLKSWMDQTCNDKNDLILQMDIEGAEYRVLIDTPLEYLSRYRIIVIEFHNLHKMVDTLGYELIDLTLEKLNKLFTVVHIHPNNCSISVKYDGLDIPPVLEVTYLRKDRHQLTDHVEYLPHVLDKNCVDKNMSVKLSKYWLKNI